MNERLCVDCGRAFVVGPEQAARYAARGWAPPRRCPACRSARRKPHVDPNDPVDAPAETTTPPKAAKAAKAARAAKTAPKDAPAAVAAAGSAASGSSSSSDVDYDLEDPPDVPPEAPGPSAPAADEGAFEVQCSACGELTRVKFQPTGKRPVYCRRCFDLR